LSKNSITLNKKLNNDYAVVNVTTTPYDADLPAVTGDVDKFSISITGKSLKIKPGAGADAGKSYKLKIGKSQLTVKVADADPVIELNAKGVFNVIDPDSRIILAPKFTNYGYCGGDVRIDNDNFEIVSVDPAGAVTLRMKDVPVKVKTGQRIVLTYSDTRGSYASGAIVITPGQVKPLIYKSVKTIDLQKNDRYSEGMLDLAVMHPEKAVISSVEISGAEAALYSIRKVQNGSYAIGFKDNVIGKDIKSSTIKLDVYLAGSDKPVSMNMKIVIS